MRSFIGAARLAAISSVAATITLGVALAQPAEKPYEPTVGQQGKDVVWVPTPQTLVDKMLDMVKLTPSDIHYDLGSGDGRTVITAAKRGATAFGVEYNPKMVELSRANAEKEGVAGKATFIEGDIFQTDFSKATVISLFLLPDLNERLRPTILNMKPGTRVVSNSFSMGDWQPDERAEVTEDCRGYCRALFWIVPAKVDGTWTMDRGSSSTALSFKQEYQKLTGTIADGNVVTPVTEGKLRGDEISFTAGGVEYTGKVDGDTIAGTTKSGETWQAKRGAPAVTAQAPAPQPSTPQAAPQAPAAETPAPKAVETPAAKAPDIAAKGEEPPFVPEVSQDGKDVVWWPTANTLVNKMLDLAKLTPKDRLIDLGSGDGRTVITAAQRGATALGIEYNPKMVELSQFNARKAGVTEKATFRRGDIFRTNFSNADVLTLFLLPELNERLRPTILRMKPGTRVVSNTFEMGDWEPDQIAEVTDNCQTYCKALLWIVPARVEGRWRMGRDTITLKQKFQTVTGNIRRGKAVTPITDGKLNGSEITFTAGGTEYTGKVNGRSITGVTKSGTKWSARRA
ncbi:class I SAM-dependent methyltransferase [Pseudorhodoplanes sp.]|uniref:class I SAM-dependent methyltransferase n=1 Tax=Pseudorhodoplanes sp. TaxID=1934341 RepID=UPI002B5B9799|nr:methyltransferase domain-containing protein [Pseudorhodoplanes sp.]HWV51851.1 methyltransferase domain-containing protein [Pseudorhodoplanes sp.]